MAVVTMDGRRSTDGQLRVDGTGKTFGGLETPSDVAPGSITSLIDPNGSGKATFFNSISGVFRPSGGEVFFKAPITYASCSRTIRCVSSPRPIRAEASAGTREAKDPVQAGTRSSLGGGRP
jgi:ABC-type phosphonate transport system ATPase subunit